MHAKLTAFADVRIVVTHDVLKAKGMDLLFEEVQKASTAGGRVSNGEFAETQCFSVSDQTHSPYQCASELARWADVLLIAPMCSPTLSDMVAGHQHDLLLEVAQYWGEPQKFQSGSPGASVFWRLEKPFIVSLLLPAEQRRSNLILEKQMKMLEQMGLQLVDDPADKLREEGGHEEYVNQVVDYVRHAVLEVQGLQQAAPRKAPTAKAAKAAKAAAAAGGPKRKRGAS